MAESTEPKQTEPKQKENLYRAEYLGSGTFRITKPKRGANKQRETRVHNPRKRSRRS